MKEKAPKVKDLAAELGVSARQIVKRARAAGLPVQNSLTRLKPDSIAAIRAWFASRGENDDCSTCDPADTMSA